MHSNKKYLLSIVFIMFVFPLLSMIIEGISDHSRTHLIELIGKWFVFWAIGIRLFMAGINQVMRPGFTVQKIFKIDDPQSHAFVRELGFANISIGTLGLLSLFVPQLLLSAAISGGLFLGLAGIHHIIKKPASTNEYIAMITDLLIFLIMLFYVISQF